MPPRPKGKLTRKEEAVIADVVRGVKANEGMHLSESIQKIHGIKKTSARAMATRKMQNEDFRIALLTALEERKIIGADSKVEKVLVEGLDAEKESGDPDHRLRLDFVKEVNKIAGVYAPEKRETKSMSLNLNMSEEELRKKIKELDEELSD